MIDRTMQKEILEFLYSIYPDFAQPFSVPRYEEKNFRFNLFYLHGHGLVSGEKGTECGDREFLHVTITPKGIDFLSDDGGLGAVLGVVTVKIHTESIVAMIEAHLLNADIPKEEKSIMISGLKKASAITTTELLKQLAGLALSQAPHAYKLLKNIVLD